MVDMRLGLGAISIFVCSLASAAPVELTPAQRDAAVATWRALAPSAIEAKPIAALPDGLAVARVDVSPRMRSASFGHSTTLLIPDGARQLYVEYGRSTNHPAALFGPFPVR